MRAIIWASLLALVLGTSTSANEIYIEQIGDTLDLDITQDGENNQFGDSTTDVTLDGDSMTFDITQTGNSNDIAAVIKGNTYTGTWEFTGNNNTVDLLCDSTSGTNCENVTLNITTTGNTNKFNLKVGQTDDADSAEIDFVIDGDGNVLISEIDGSSAILDITVDNSNSNSTAQFTDSDTNLQTGQGGVLVVTDQDGDGDSAGHTIKLDVTGGGSRYDIKQSGVNDNLFDGTFQGDGHEVDIIQSD